MPGPLLKLVRYIPAHPMTMLRRVNSLFTAYGRQIIRAEGSSVDTEKQANNKDITSALSAYLRSLDLHIS